MPGEDRTIEVTIAGETWEIEQLRGYEAIRKMPDIISILSQLLYAAYEGGIPLNKMLEGDTDITITLTDAISAINFVSVALGKNFDKFEHEVVPFLLQRDHAWLEKNGTIREHVIALWAALRFHIETSLGDETMKTVKNYLAAEEEAAGE